MSTVQIPLAALQSDFESRIGTFTMIAKHQFRALGAEARAEAVQNTLTLCWKYFLRLAETGKQYDDTLVNAMCHYATRHTRSGRMIQRSLKSKDAIERARHGKLNRAGLDLNYYIEDKTPIPDAVAYRIDVPAFLATLPERNREIARELGQGLPTKEVAAHNGVSAGRVSQLRTELRDRWEAFQGE